MTIEIDFIQDSHGVGLARSCLPVDKVTAMITIQNMEHQRQCTLLKDLLLRGLLIKDLAELEISLVPFLVIMQRYPTWLCHLNAAP